VRDPLDGCPAAGLLVGFTRRDGSGPGSGRGMDATLVGGLLVLALIDSTSIGTLVLPIWLLLSATRPPVRRLLGYLATIAGFYLVVGVGLVLVADAGLQRFGDLANRPAVLWLQLLVGVGLFALSWRYDSGRRRAPAGRVLRRDGAARPGPGRAPRPRPCGSS
jgi:hypothetical protein